MTEQLFNQIHTEYYPRIYRYCYAKLNKNLEDARDCAQDVFCALLVSSTITNYDNLQYWLYTVADRYIYKMWNRNRRLIYEEDPGVGMEDVLYDKEFDELQLKLLTEDIARQLTPKENRLFQLLNRPDYDIAAVAKVLGRCVSAVYKQKQSLNRKVHVLLSNMNA